MPNWIDRIGSILSDTDDIEPVYYPALREQRFGAAILLLRHAIALDDGHAMGIYAGLLALGRGIERNPEEAALWFRQSAVRDDPFGQISFALCLAIGFGIAQDRREAAFWLCRAARAGHRRAMEVLADLVLLEPGLIGNPIRQEELDIWLTMLPRRGATN